MYLANAEARRRATIMNINVHNMIPNTPGYGSVISLDIPKDTCGEGVRVEVYFDVCMYMSAIKIIDTAFSVLLGHAQVKCCV
jgi:hypothetical protein